MEVLNSDTLIYNSEKNLIIALATFAVKDFDGDVAKEYMVRGKSGNVILYTEALTGIADIDNDDENEVYTYVPKYIMQESNNFNPEFIEDTRKYPVLILIVVKNIEEMLTDIHD